MRYKLVALFSIGLALCLLVGCIQSDIPKASEQTGFSSTESLSPPDNQASPTVNMSMNGTPATPIQAPRETVMEDNNSEPAQFKSAMQLLVEQAMQDLALRLGVTKEQIDLLEVRQVTWPDSSLGCPQPGMAYIQLPQEGLLIRLGVGREMYFYHSSETQPPFLCEGTSQVIPKVTPKTDEFVPPPDAEID